MGPISFNIFSIDLFFILNDADIANLEDVNTLCFSTKNVEHVIESLERPSVSLFKCFENNPFRGNVNVTLL